MTFERTKVSRSNLSQTQMVDIQSKKIEMTLNTDSSIASGLLIQRLTELYENPIEASVRETVSNGLDAVAIGHSGERAEIRIETPSRLNPILSIADNGPGMSYEDLVNVYSKYGASTKQNNFDQVGAYGLGAKSPLAYGTQFTVSSVNNGIKTVVIVAREETTNYIKVVDSFETDEPSGTVVSIPVNSNDIDAFTQVVYKYEKSPADYDADLYINDSLVSEENKDWKLVLHNVEISEGVSVRLWSRDVKSFVYKMCATNGLEQMLENTSFVIGGWIYNNPKKTNWMRGGTGDLVVELKPGYVSFNSSRDNILNNERFSDLLKSIKSYPTKKAFKEDFENCISNENFISFKEILKESYRFFAEFLKIEDNKLQLMNVNMSQNQKAITKILLKMKQKESGFNIESIPSYLKIEFKKIYSFFYDKSKYSYRPQYGGYLKKYDGNLFRKVSGYNLKEILSMNEDALKEDEFYHLISVLLDIQFKKEKILLITDIPEEDLEKTYQYVIRKREDIIRGLNFNGNLDLHSVDIHIVSGTKENFSKMLEDCSIEPSDLIFFDINEFKSRNKTVAVQREKKDIEKNLNNLSMKTYSNTNEIKRIKESEFGDNNLFVLVENTMSFQDFCKVKIWYANEKNLDLDEIQLVMIDKSILAFQLEIISQYGEVFLSNNNLSVRKSKALDSVLKGSVQKEIIQKKSKNKRISSFVALLESITNMDLNTIFHLIENKVSNAFLIAKAVNVELDKESYKKFKEILKDFIKTPEYIHYRFLNSSEIELLSKQILKEDFETLELTTILLLEDYNSNFKLIQEDGSVKSFLRDSKLTINLPKFSEYEHSKEYKNKNILKQEELILKAKIEIIKEILGLLENFRKEGN